MSFLIWTSLFFLGASCGSFLNVLISRTVSGEDWVSTRSKCDHCGKHLKAYDMVPILSFLWLRGRCRYCKARISWQHPLVEVIIGLLFLWWGVVGFAFFRLVTTPLAVIQPLYWLLIGFIFLGVFFSDLYYGLIPDIFVWSGLLITLLYRLALVSSGGMRIQDFYIAIVVSLATWLGFLLLHALTGGRGMGFGDVKLSLVIGLILGWPRIIPGLFISFVLGALVGVVLIALGRKKLGQTLPFGPFLVVGTFSSLLWGDLFLKFLGI